MKVVLFGVSGQVGYELAAALPVLGDVVTVARAKGPWVAERLCDLSDPSAITALLHQVRPDLVVNAAAYTAVDLAEDEPRLARQLNAEAPAAMAHYAADTGSALVHYSTDYVFAGDANQAYRERDPTGPVGAYGHSKLAGEQAISGSGCAHLILRTSWVYADRGKNFLLTMLRLAGEREELSVVADQIGSPTYAGTLAELTTLALQRVIADDWDSLGGTYHLSSSGSVSWHGFADTLLRRAAKLGLIKRAPVVQAIDSKQFPTKATRPAWSVLDNSRFQQQFGLEVPSWQTQLEDCLQRLAQTDRAP